MAQREPVDEALARRIMFEVHSDLPREGPGDRASTARALAALGPLPEAPEVLDIACGPGMQTLHLAELLPAASFTAVDAHAPFLAATEARLRAAGHAERVKLVKGDMRTLRYPDASFDLLWCEGAAYIMGVQTALETWRSLLRPKGAVAFTEVVWLTDSPPEELSDWWRSEYPDMGDRQACVDKVVNAGYRLLDTFVLPESAWWDDYYTPLESRLARLRRRYQDDPMALAELAEHQREIDYYRRWSAHYGYLFVAARRTD